MARGLLLFFGESGPGIPAREFLVLQVDLCRRAATVSPAPLLARFGEYQRIVGIEERFACTECGNRAGNSVKVWLLNRNA